MAKTRSVLMCTYNGEKYLPFQLDSVLSQTLKPDELVIVDDGSRDGTGEILNEYSKRYNFIKVYQNKENIGVVRNFQKALELSSGEVIFFCDQDDIWDPEKISIMTSELGDGEFLFSDAVVIDANGERLSDSEIQFLGITPVFGKNPFYFLSSNCVSGHNLVVSRDLAFRALPFSSHVMFDQWLALVASLTSGVRFLDRKLVQHRMHDNNFVNNKKINRLKENSNQVKSQSRKDRIFSKHYKYRDVVQDLSLCNIKSSVLDIIIDHYELFEKRYFNLKLFMYLMKNENKFYRNTSIINKIDKNIRFCRCAKGYWLPGIKF